MTVLIQRCVIENIIANSKTLFEYAKKRERKGLIQITNLQHLTFNTDK